MNSWVWLWLILLTFLAGGGWFALAIYADHLLVHGRYNAALKLVSVLFISRVSRSRLRADVLTAAGRYEESARILREAFHRVRGRRLTKIRRVKAYFDLETAGNVLMEFGRFEEAQRFFQNGARLYPYHSGWSTGMAETLLRQGVSPKDALAHAEKALNLFQHGAERIVARSRLGEILATKGWALAACGRRVEAEDAIDAALKSSARKTKGPLAQVHYKAGMSFLALSDFRGAEEHFARGAELDPAGRWGTLCADALSRQNCRGPS